MKTDENLEAKEPSAANEVDLHRLVRREFRSEKEMVEWLMNNPGKYLKDTYGRRWIYGNYRFSFGDIGDKVEYDTIKCLHLYGTELYG